MFKKLFIAAAAWFFGVLLRSGDTHLYNTLRKLPRDLEAIPSLRNPSVSYIVTWWSERSHSISMLAEDDRTIVVYSAKKSTYFRWQNDFHRSLKAHLQKRLSALREKREGILTTNQTTREETQAKVDALLKNKP